MKKRNKERLIIIGSSTLITLMLIITIWLPINELFFKIYENKSEELVEVDRIPIAWKNKENLCNSSDFTIINEKTDYGECAWIYSEQITIEWLDENCECIEKDCEYVFNSSKREKFDVDDSKRFIAKTYEGLIWFTTDEEGNEIVEYYHGNVELIEKCNPCQKYSCGEDHVVEVWNQIK